MSDADGLRQALRCVIELRDKVVVVRLAPSVLTKSKLLDQLASSLALLRALGVRLIVIVEPSSANLGPAAARCLSEAISRHGQRATTVAAAEVLTIQPPSAPPVHPAPAKAAPSAFIPAPGSVVGVEPVLLMQLASLGYIVLVLLPVITADGAVLEVAGDEVGAALGMYLAAELLVFVRDRKALAAPLPVTAVGRRTVVTSADAGDEILSDMLLARPPRRPAAARGKSPRKSSRT